MDASIIRNMGPTEIESRENFSWPAVSYHCLPLAVPNQKQAWKGGPRDAVCRGQPVRAQGGVESESEEGAENKQHSH